MVWSCLRTCLYVEYCYWLIMSSNLFFSTWRFGIQGYDWGEKTWESLTKYIDWPSIRMRGQLCDGRIGRTAVIEQGHHRQKTAAVEMESIEVNLRVPGLSRSTAQDTRWRHGNHKSKQSVKRAIFQKKILTYIYIYNYIYICMVSIVSPLYNIWNTLTLNHYMTTITCYTVTHDW